MDELLVDPALEAFRKRQHEEKLAKAKATAPGTKAPPSTEESGPPLRPLPKLEGSQVAFFLDGECQGVAFEDLYDFLPLRKIKNPGTNTTTRERSKKDSRALMENWHDDGATGYFPMVSVFGGGIATLNPGPSFDFPPPSGDLDPVLAQSPHPPTKPRVKMPGADGGGHWRPLCERYDEFVEEQAYLDDLDAQEAVRVLLEAKQDALRAAAAAAGAGASQGISSGGGGGAALATTASGTATPTSKKARIATEVSLAQATTAAVTAAAAASNRLAALGVVKAESGAAAAQTESPAQSPSPLPPPPPTSAALPSFSSSSAAAT
jgi:COMPASS component BRE2